jgi:hypothetical protein
LTRGVTLTLTEVQFHSQDTVAFDASTTRERLDAPFEISRGITLPVGAQYDVQRYIIRARPPTAASSRSTDDAAGASSIPAHAKKRLSISTSASAPVTSSTPPASGIRFGSPRGTSARACSA